MFNTNLIGNCFPIVITILNLQKTNELLKHKRGIPLFSFIYGIIGSLVILLLKFGKQAAFEWVGLYSVLYFFFEYISKKTDRLFQKDLMYNEVNKDGINTYYKIVRMLNILIAMIIIFLTLSPIFDKIIYRTSTIYQLSKFNYLICAISYILFSAIIHKKLKDKEPLNNEESIK